MPSNEPEQPQNPSVDQAPKYPMETDGEAITCEHTRLNDEANNGSKNRSYVPEAVQGKYPQGFDINERAWLKDPPGPPGGSMAVTITDAQRHPGTRKWQYQLKDLGGQEVTDKSGEVGWFEETRLRRG